MKGQTDFDDIFLKDVGEDDDAPSKPRHGDGDGDDFGGGSDEGDDDEGFGGGDDDERETW